jgi:hypothetical protein
MVPGEESCEDTEESLNNEGVGDYSDVRGYVVRFADGTFAPSSGLNRTGYAEDAHIFKNQMEAHLYATHAVNPGQPKWEIVSAASAMGESLQERGHKAGCQCGFCKNKGSFKNRPKSEEDSESGGLDSGDATEDSTDMKEESLKTPEDVVNAMLEWNPKNPGTQPGILGTKSFSTMKVPSGHTDRKFSPAPGMVQPDSEIVNKQAKRKVNSGK